MEECSQPSLVLDATGSSGYRAEVVPDNARYVVHMVFVGRGKRQAEMSCDLRDLREHEKGH